MYHHAMKIAVAMTLLYFKGSSIKMLTKQLSKLSISFGLNIFIICMTYYIVIIYICTISHTQFLIISMTNTQLCTDGPICGSSLPGSIPMTHETS